MFGIAKPCRHTIGAELHREWMSHLCGLCLGLRDAHGHSARLTTNVDAVVLSILVEAQRPAPLERRHAGACALRGMRSASVVTAGEAATGHAVAVSLTMAATKVDDHAVDGDGLPGRVPGAARFVARRWRDAGARAGAEVAFDTAALEAAVVDSEARQQVPGATFDHYAAPTEVAAAAAFAHTAVLAGVPTNAEPLAELGAMFGRLTYLLDAVVDEDDDVAAGRFNPLVAAEPDAAARRRLAVHLRDDAQSRLTAAFDRLVLARAELARAVVVDQVDRAGRRALHRAAGHDHAPTCRARTAAEVAAAGRTARVLTKVAVATGLAFPGFRPGVGPGAGGEVPPTVPPSVPIDPAAQAEAQRRAQAAPPVDDGGGCCSSCDCCDCCDCCDGCDCCDC